MTKQKISIYSLLFVTAILLVVSAPVSYAETSEQMEQRIRQLKGSSGESDPLVTANKKLSSGTIHYKDVTAVVEAYHRGHEQYIKAMNFFDKVIYLKRGSPGYVSNKDYPQARQTALYYGIQFAQWDKDADREFKYASDYLKDYPKGQSVSFALSAMEHASKLKKGKESQAAAANKKISDSANEVQKDPDGDLKKAVLSMYSNEIAVANMDNDESGMLMGSNMTEPRITIEWQDESKSQANVVYDFRAPALRGKIGHYREISMKRINGRWQLEKILKDIKSGMGNVQ